VYYIVINNKNNCIYLAIEFIREKNYEVEKTVQEIFLR
jgi:hypothetical protein